MERLYLELRGLMTAQDVTIKQLARGVGVSVTHINDILAGRTYPKTDLCYDILKLYTGRIRPDLGGNNA